MWRYLALFALNLALYTAYSKTKKTLDFSQLLDVLLVKKGLWFTLDELNKVAGLNLGAIVGLYPLQMAGLERSDLVLSVLTLLFHIIYTLVRYYGEDTHVPRVSTWFNFLGELKSPKGRIRLLGNRKISTLFAVLSSTLVFCWWSRLDLVGVYSLGSIVDSLMDLVLLPFGGARRASFVLSFLTVMGSLLHFYLMEVDHKMVLRVRPWGYLVFVLASFGLFGMLFSL